MKTTFTEFNEGYAVEKTVVFKNKNNPHLEVTVTKTPDGRITSIEKSSDSIRFPYSVGQLFNRNLEVWACNNNYYMDGKDTCPEKKIFGMRASDIPKGHELRTIYPGKFR